MDEDGSFTWIAHNGSSIIDYFIMSRCVVPLASYLNVVPISESKHMPIEMTLKLLCELHDFVKKKKKERNEEEEEEVNLRSKSLHGIK